MSSDGYDRMVELVAENPALEAEELVELATDDFLDADDTRQWLEDAEAASDVIERGGKYGVVRKGKFAFGAFDHPV